MDWFKRLFSDPATIVVLASSGVIGFVAGFANGIVQKRHEGWMGLLAAIMSAIIVAVIVGLAINSYVTSETLRLAIVGACAVISEDIRAGLKSLGLGLRTDPLGTVTRILDALRARPTQPSDKE